MPIFWFVFSNETLFCNTSLGSESFWLPTVKPLSLNLPNAGEHLQGVTGLASLWTSFYRVVTTLLTTVRRACWPISDHSAATIPRRCLPPFAAGYYCEAPPRTSVGWRSSAWPSGSPTAPGCSSAASESASTCSCGSTRRPTARWKHEAFLKAIDNMSTWRIDSTLNCTTTRCDYSNGGCRKRWDKNRIPIYRKSFFQLLSSSILYATKAL